MINSFGNYSQVSNNPLQIDLNRRHTHNLVMKHPLLIELSDFAFKKHVSINTNSLY